MSLMDHILMDSISCLHYLLIVVHSITLKYIAHDIICQMFKAKLFSYFSNLYPMNAKNIQITLTVIM